MFKAKQITHVLPRLFAVIDLTKQATDNELDTKLLLHAGQFIGDNLSDLLQRGQHRPEILSRLRQEFRSWDGEVPLTDRPTGSDKKPLLLALIQTEDGWKKVGVIEDLSPDTNEDPNLEAANFTTRGAYSLGDQPPQMTSTAILIPDADAGILVQSRSLPPSGPCYFLVPKDLISNWRVWLHNQRDLRWSSGSIPQIGLDEGEILEVIENTDELSDEALKSMPGAPPPARMQRLRFVGGTRIGRTIGGSLYLAYDLPLLRVVVEGAAPPASIGGALEPMPQITGPTLGKPGETQIRHFRLLPDQNSTHIKVTHGTSSVDLHVGFLSDSDARTAGNLAVNSFGRAVDVEFGNVMYCRGASCPVVQEDVTDELPSGFGSLNDGDSRPLPDAPGVKLSEVLRGLAENVGGAPLSWQRARHAIRRVAEQNEDFVPQFEISRVLRSLCDLGHLDIATDQHGRWSWISLPRPQSYLLPWTDCNGNNLATIAGCVAFEFWSLAEKAALSRGINVTWRNQSDVSSMLPPRMIIRGPIGALRDWAGSLELPFSETSAACAISFWSKDISSWRANLPTAWSEDLGESTHIYAPALFKMKEANQGCSIEPNRIALIQCYDPYTGSNSLFKLVKKLNGIPQGIPCSDLAWGKWLDYNSILSPLGVQSGIPRDNHTGDLIVPIQLRLPYLLSRAATLSSGLAPLVETGHAVFRDPSVCDKIQLASEPYMGACVIYRHVPESISHRIAGQLGAKIIEWERPRATDSGRIRSINN